MKLRGPMPDITPAQIVAVLGWIAAQAVAFGWITDMDAQLAVSVGATVIAGVLKLADAYLRGQRVAAVAVNPSIATSSPAPPAPPA